jgi:K+-transporting ATPase ATPase A chain
MTAESIALLVAYVAVLLAVAPLLGGYMARVYQGETVLLSRVLGPVERLAYRFSGVRPDDEMGWKRYATALLVFSALGLLAVYALQRLQGLLPLNPAGLGAVSPDLAFNTAASFASNTNWQSYGGETTLSHLTQMVALTVQNFVSAAAGMAVAVALFRGLARKSRATLGNFWVDLTRGTLYVLIPLAFVLAPVLVSQGVVQTLQGAARVTLLDPTAAGAGGLEQLLALGPAASQIAIKQLGTNGGGFFNVNAAHPFENPTAVTNFLQMLAILLIPAALCVTFGRMVGDRRQGAALLAAMTVLFVAAAIGTMVAEQAPNPLLHGLGVDQIGGSMEGKEVRFGPAASALWATATTAASNGSVNAMHDSFSPLGGLWPLALMLLGEVVFGGVGSGLYGMLVFVVIAVFVAGLMVGRTPEYLGKKIEPFEMKMAALVILVPPLLITVGTAVAVLSERGTAAVANPGAHGFTEILYAVTSAANNNGSAFAGLSANAPFWNTLLGVAMLVGRFWLMVPVLALAGSLARKGTVPAGPGTLPTHTPLFVTMLIAVVVLVGALAFVPALALGPIAEHLTQNGGIR